MELATLNHTALPFHSSWKRTIAWLGFFSRVGCVDEPSNTAAHPVSAYNQVGRDRKALIGKYDDAIVFLFQRRDSRRSLHQSSGVF